MEIYLIRHTTPNIAKGICYGQSDIDITTSFDNELNVIKSKLANTSPNTIYSSPLLRCKKLAKALGENVYYDNRLKELDFGSWELQLWNDIPKYEIDPWMKDFVTTPTTNGESYIDLQNRVISFFEEIIKTQHKTIFLITHAGAIRTLISHITNLDLKESFSIKVDYGDVFKLSHTFDSYQKL